MYEEDRVRALEMYEDIFDEVGNETEVLQMLVSPTRQAVNLARAYDAKERKYQDDGQEPAYQLVIEDLRRQAAALQPAAPKVDEEQISLFHDAAPAENVYDSMGFDILPDVPEHDSGTQTRMENFGLFPDEDRADEPAPLTPPPAAPAAPAAEEAPAQEVDDFSDAVDAFLKDFAINDELTDAKQKEGAKAPVADIQDEDAAQRPEPPRAPEKEEAKAPQTPPAQEHPPVRVQTPRAEQRVIQDLPDMTGKGERKANVPALILFLLLAIPVGLVCLAVILSLAALSLSLAAGGLYVGVSGLIAAFGFSVFADILLVFGLSLALTGLSLLFLWVFIWLLAGAIPDLVRGICALARKLCCKEVSA